MNDISFYLVDIVIVFIVLISLVIGWFRGGTKEILSLAAWFLSIYLTIKLFPSAKETMRLYIQHGLIADFVTYAILFVLFLIVLSFLNYLCSNFVKNSILNQADCFLGGIFGLVRGLLIISILEFCTTQYLLSEQNIHLNNSRLKPIVKDVTNFVVLLLPENLQIKVFSYTSLARKQEILNFFEKDFAKIVNENLIQEKSNISSFGLNNIRVEATVENSMKDIAVDNFKVKTQSAEEIATLKLKKNIDIEKNDENLIEKPNLLDTKKNAAKNRVLDEYID